MPVITDLWLDFETRSHCNLTQRGADNYATHPTTEIICLRYAFGAGQILSWVPIEGERIPDDLVEAALSDYTYFYASNARFDRLIWEFVAVQDHSAPVIPLNRWRCSQYAARCNNLPSKLDNVTRCLQVEHRKNPKGKKLIDAMCIPPYQFTYELLDEMIDYCGDDVAAMRDAYLRHRAPTIEEWQDYTANEEINDRGVLVDLELAQAAVEYASDEEEELIARIIEASDGAITKARGEKLKKWVMERLTEEQVNLTVKYISTQEVDEVTGIEKRVSVKKYSLDKMIRGRLLEEELDIDVYTVLECSDFAQKSSVSKFKNMIKLADPNDGRVRGAFLANGAAQSGRYSSRGLQLHNFTRDCMKDPTKVRTMMIEGASADELRKAFELPIMTILSRMLRAALIPTEGCTFFAPDWSSIEGRVAPWLTDSPAGNLKLEVYCHSDNDPDADDVYTDTARGIFPVGTEIEDKERQTGKVTELSMQYQGGGNALRRMGLNYGVYFSIEEAEGIKKQWRENNPWCVNMWVRCEAAAFKALKYPGNSFEAGRLSYICLEEVLNFPKVLFCELPSGRFLTYPDIRIEMKPAPWDETKMIQQLTALHSTWTPKATETEWPRSSLYGGILFQHGCQATAADCMRWLLREPAYVVAHVHDEGLYELPIVEDFHEQTRDDVLLDMSAGPEWAAGLPLVAAGEFLERYGK